MEIGIIWQLTLPNVFSTFREGNIALFLLKKDPIIQTTEITAHKLSSLYWSILHIHNICID